MHKFTLNERGCGSCGTKRPKPTTSPRPTTTRPSTGW